MIGIKCKSGIVLASDSQGTSEDEKTIATKIFSIKNLEIGIGASGYYDNMRDFAREMKIEAEWDSETDFRKKLFAALYNFNSPMSVNTHDTLNPIVSVSYDMKLDVLMGLKIKEDDYCLYQIGLKDFKKPHISLIEDNFKSIGSGKKLANLLLKQQSRIYNLFELSLSLLIGIALFVVEEVKGIDSFSGGDTQVAVIENNGYRKIPFDEYSQHYEKMIYSLSETLGKRLSDSSKDIDTLKKLFPVSKSVSL